MTNKLLDAKVIFNNAEIDVVNSDMDVLVAYEIKMLEDFLGIDLLKVSGKIIEREINKNGVSIKTEYNFQTNNTWHLTSNIPIGISELYPAYAIINFDNKHITIKF
jgi:hypothetical protein